MTDQSTPHTTDLPGSRPFVEELEQCIRVNQAGEYGAKRIYEGQIAILKNDSCYETLHHMAEQEQEHLSFFNSQLTQRHIRPTILTPLWHVAGFALGAGTALLGKEAAMACTVAVEEVIDEHYQEQLSMLKQHQDRLTSDENKLLVEKIEQFRLEELEHRDIGLQNNAEQAPAYKALTSAIKCASKLAIFLSKRI